MAGLPDIYGIRGKSTNGDQYTTCNHLNMYYGKLSVLEAQFRTVREETFVPDSTLLCKTIFCYGRIYGIQAERKNFTS